MIISFWDCEYSEWEEYWDEGGGEHVYMCHHPNGVGYCNLENKYEGQMADCKLLDKETP